MEKELLNGLGDTGTAFSEVATQLRIATLNELDPKDERYKALLDMDFDEFWSRNLEIIASIEIESPGAGEKIMQSAEAGMNELIRQREEALPEEIRAARREAFRRGLMRGFGFNI